MVFPRPLAARARSLLRAGAAFAVLAAASACSRPDSSATYAVVVHVDGDPGRPLAGAVVSAAGHRVGATGDSGSLTLSVRGIEGEHVPVSVVCPDGFQSPTQPTDVVLHRLAEPGRKPEYDVTCVPARHVAVVVVRADHGPHLPVLYLGREVARTDDSGAAHALVEVPANEDIEVTLSTIGPGAERLRPQNPSMKFTASDQNEIKIFSVQFEVEPDKRRASGPRIPRPVRLN